MFRETCDGARPKKVTIATICNAGESETGDRVRPKIVRRSSTIQELLMSAKGQ